MIRCMQAHLRVARATDHLDDVVRFYRDGLGFELVGEFHDHEGFDGVMLGHAGAGYHLEFTVERGAVAGRAPGRENLLVFYLPDAGAFAAAVARMEAQGHAAVASHNPYWDRGGKTYEDADGYRVVLCHGGWENVAVAAGVAG
jgi:catechol 2,3-dioxygenase-like lactoylglutathione lyase family enzyme